MKSYVTFSLHLVSYPQGLLSQMARAVVTREKGPGGSGGNPVGNTEVEMYTRNLQTKVTSKNKIVVIYCCITNHSKSVA